MTESRWSREAAQGPNCEKRAQKFGYLKEFTGEGGRNSQSRPENKYNRRPHTVVLTCYPSITGV